MSNDLTKGLEEFIRQRTSVIIFPATVTAVDAHASTCTVEDVEGIEYFNVRMRAAVDNSLDGLTISPKIGSRVLVGNIGNSDHSFCLVAYTLIEAIEIRDATTIYIYGGAVKLGQDAGSEPLVKGSTLNSNLQQLNTNLTTLATALQTFATTQNAAATGPLAPLQPGYAALNSAISTLQSQLGSWAASLSNHLSNITETG